MYSYVLYYCPYYRHWSWATELLSSSRKTYWSRGLHNSKLDNTTTKVTVFPWQRLFVFSTLISISVMISDLVFFTTVVYYSDSVLLFIAEAVKSIFGSIRRAGTCPVKSRHRVPDKFPSDWEDNSSHWPTTLLISKAKINMVKLYAWLKTNFTGHKIFYSLNLVQESMTFGVPMVIRRVWKKERILVSSRHRHKIKICICWQFIESRNQLFRTHFANTRL